MLYAVVVLFAVVFLIIFFEFFLKSRGDCHIVYDSKRLEKLFIHENQNELQLVFSFPFVNKGKQQGLMIDCFSGLEPKGDTFRNYEIQSRVVNNLNPRNDSYWEGFIIKEGKECQVTVQLRFFINKENEREIARKNLETFKVEIHYKYYGRNLMTNKRIAIPFKLSEFEISEKPVWHVNHVEPEKPSEEQDKPESKGAVIPVKTHLLGPDDDLVEVIQKYVSGKAAAGDIVAIAETAVAIMQGRIHYVEDIKPCMLARKINKLFDRNSSLSSPYSLEMAFREVGVMRILIATMAGFFGKLIGRSGDFYRVAGKDVATIDDCTGTLPPFDKYIVMGPSKPKEVVRMIKEKTGLEAAIVDVNDLKRVDILALTCPDKKEHIKKALEPNPQGNANQQTPIVIIRT